MAYYEPLVSQVHPLLTAPKSFFLLSRTEFALIDLTSISSTTTLSITFHPPVTPFHQRLRLEFYESTVDYFNKTGGCAGIFSVLPNSITPPLSINLGLHADFKRRFPTARSFLWIPLFAIVLEPIHSLVLELTPETGFTALYGFKLGIEWCEVIECIV